MLHCSNFSWVYLINWQCMLECSASEVKSGVGLVKHQRGTLSVRSITAFSGHMTQIGHGHSSVFYEDLMSQQCDGSAALRFCPARFDSRSEVEGRHMCMSGGCCVLSWQQHRVPPSLC